MLNLLSYFSTTYFSKSDQDLSELLNNATTKDIKLHKDLVLKELYSIFYMNIPVSDSYNLNKLIKLVKEV